MDGYRVAIFAYGQTGGNVATTQTFLCTVYYNPIPNNHEEPKKELPFECVWGVQSVPFRASGFFTGLCGVVRASQVVHIFQLARFQNS